MDDVEKENLLRQIEKSQRGEFDYHNTDTTKTLESLINKSNFGKKEEDNGKRSSINH